MKPKRKRCYITYPDGIAREGSVADVPGVHPWRTIQNTFTVAKMTEECVPLGTIIEVDEYAGKLVGYRDVNGILIARTDEGHMINGLFVVKFSG